jgi:molybdopterin-guanine dinucleotide biosynthesis adapter protein
MGMKVIGFIGDSGSGKTTLVERLIARFAASGMRVAAVKHAHKGFDMDRPGKDSYRFRAAGAGQVLVASESRWALLCEETELGAQERLERQLARLAPCDVVLVEGFRDDPGIPYIEVQRRQDEPLGRGERAPAQGVVAIAADAQRAQDAAQRGLPVFDLDDIDSIAAFIGRTLELPRC